MAFPELFQPKRSQGGEWFNCFPVCNNMYSTTLAADTEATVVTPGTVANWAVRFNLLPLSVVWMSIVDTAAVPTDDTITSTTSTLLVPGVFYVIPKGVTISLINAAGGVDVGIEMYGINQI